MKAFSLTGLLSLCMLVCQAQSHNPDFLTWISYTEKGIDYVSHDLLARGWSLESEGEVGYDYQRSFTREEDRVSFKWLPISARIESLTLLDFGNEIDDATFYLDVLSWIEDSGLRKLTTAKDTLETVPPMFQYITYYKKTVGSGVNVSTTYFTVERISNSERIIGYKYEVTFFGPRK